MRVRRKQTPSVTSQCGSDSAHDMVWRKSYSGTTLLSANTVATTACHHVGQRGGTAQRRLGVDTCCRDPEHAGSSRTTQGRERKTGNLVKIAWVQKAVVREGTGSATTCRFVFCSVRCGT